MKLGLREKQVFMNIIGEDLRSIEKVFSDQLSIHWGECYEEVLVETGRRDVLKRKAQLEKRLNKLQAEIHALQAQLRTEPLTPEQVQEFDGCCNSGYWSGAHLYNISIANKIDYLTAKKLQSKIDLAGPIKFLHDLAKASHREIAMSGSYEEARAVYERFYRMDFRKYGVDIPPRLEELQKEQPLMIEQKKKEDK